MPVQFHSVDPFRSPDCNHLPLPVHHAENGAELRDRRQQANHDVATAGVEALQDLRRPDINGAEGIGQAEVYIIFFNGVPEFTEIQSQWLVFFTSVLPITLLFTFLDYKHDGSFGKVKAGLELVYQKKTVQASLTRNVIKFLPWQLGHMGTIHGLYSDFDVLSIILSISATLLAVSLLAMTMFRKDKRHLGDLLAHTQVQLKGD